MLQEKSKSRFNFFLFGLIFLLFIFESWFKIRNEYIVVSIFF
jgi:hypothetical protein